MSATTDLRAMLDERGVEWMDFGAHTCWPDDNLLRCDAYEQEDGQLYVTFYPTPEQAIEATLGRGTCEMLDMDNYEDADGAVWDDHWECSECEGKTFGVYVSVNQIAPPRYCPNCGRKVRA